MSEDEARIRELEGRLRRISHRVADQLPATLYHYTTSPGLFGILSEGKLRAYSFRQMNDSSEFNYGAGLIAAALEEKAEEVGDREHRLLANVRMLLNRAPDDFSFYLACFSAEKNDLSQWRAYKGSSSGFAVEFDSEVAEEHTGVGFRRVLYDRDEQRKEIQGLVELALVTARGLAEDGADKVARRIANALVALACRLKDPAYEVEEEWRVIKQLRTDSPDVQVDPKGPVLKVYTELMGPPLPIASVWIGPGGSGQIPAVEQLLRKNDYRGVRVLPSEIPER